MIKITINIEAESADEIKEAFAKLAGEKPDVALKHFIEHGTVDAPVAELKEPVKTRQRATTKVEPVVAPEPTPEVTSTADPLADQSPTVTSDPLSTPVQTADPLASDPLGSTPASAPVAKDATITLQTVRDKIGTMTDKRAAVMDLVRTYKKADGQPAEKPGDLQEKDYADVLTALNLLG